MKDEFFKKLISIFDYRDLKISISFNIFIVLLTCFIVKVFGGSVIISIMTCMTAILSLGLVVQIVRKDRNIKMIVSYIVGTLFLLFATFVMYFMNIYKNNEMLMANLIKISISVIALLLDIIGFFFIMNNKNEKKKKIILVVCMVYITFVAIVTILFFASKGF